MAWYSNNTVTVTNGQRTVTGAGTDFVSNVLAGQGFVGPDGRTYEIEQVISATQLLLRTPYLGGNAGGQAYTILPTQSLMKDLADQAASLIGSFAEVRDGVGQGLFGGGNAAAPGIRFSADQDTGLYSSGPNQMSVACGGARALTVASGSLEAPGTIYTGLGTTTGDAGLMIGRLRSGDGNSYLDLHATSDTTYEARLLRFGGANGELALANTGTGLMSFVQEGSGSFCWRQGVNLRLQLSAAALDPGDDNVRSLGTGTFRFSTLFAGTGTINTSDEREKLWRGSLTAQELAAARRIVAVIGAFQWHSAVVEKGADEARFHYGVRAQEVARILMDEGVEEAQNIDFAADVHLSEANCPSFRSAFLCFDTWPDRFETIIDRTTSSILGADGKPIVTETPRVEKVQSAGNRFGLRMDQLTLFLITAQEQRLEALETAS